MKTSKLRTVLAIAALAVSSAALAQSMDHPPATNPRPCTPYLISIGAACQPQTDIRLCTPYQIATGTCHLPVTGPPTVLQGDIEFVHGATVDFADMTSRVGKLRGFVYVRVGGELLLMSVYTLPGDSRVFRTIEADPGQD